jgi:MFS family permease
MGITANVAIWVLLRFFSGIASGLIFVFSSSIVIDEIAKKGQTRLSGILYGGVGLGIFISGMIVPLLPSVAHWYLGWFILGGISIFFFCFIMFGFRGLDGEVVITSTSQTTTEQTKDKQMLNRLYLSYGCEGFGYIICATFLISMITKANFFTGHPATVWAAVGLAAIPSCVIWAKLGNHFGNVVALRSAYVLQILGVLLPIIIRYDITAVIAAFLFGATFMGITTLTLTIGKELAKGSSTKVISSLTAIYGIGQILGPIVSGLIAFVYDGYEGAFVLSAVVLIIALVSFQTPKGGKKHAICKH